MATWTTIPDSSLEPGKPIRSIDALALRDNPVAIAEHDIGAPYLVNNWYPYDRETNGDGIIYDSAVDGAVASITSPDFEIGFDYLFIAKGIGDSSASFSSIVFEPYISPANSFQSFGWMLLGNTSTTDTYQGSAILSLPRITEKSKAIRLTAQQEVGSLTLSQSNLTISRVVSTSDQSILRVRIRSDASGSNIVSGVITMLKRKTNYQEIV